MASIQEVKDAKVTVRELAGLVGSLAHAKTQVTDYPNSPSAQEYYSAQLDRTRRQWADVKAAMAEIGVEV
ncbi:hypothetical protein SEA_MILANI_49 [Microbacterium phage Milani]|nr:hypothetical protein SEA_MILANI_49 [Microbacterium phage Milani]